MMTHRLCHDKCVSAQIRGSFGVYRTTAEVDKSNVTGECSCPSELWPCKHVHALRATWERNPKSFFKLDEWLATLPKQSKASLIEAIRDMVLLSPNMLSVFDIHGFDEDEDEEMGYDE